MATTGLLVVATKRYSEFVEPLYASVQRFFHPTERTQVIVFTDKSAVPEGVQRVHQPHLPWPDATLMRYHAYLEHEALLSEMDYVFCCDADMLFVDHVGPEILSDRVATLHPGFFQVPRRRFPYETRPLSGACINPDEGHWYFAGGFNGGRTATFLETARAVRDIVDHDRERDLVPVWHEESCLNRVYCDHPPSLMLSPSYCYPESMTLPMPRKLVALDKPHAEFRR